MRLRKLAVGVAAALIAASCSGGGDDTSPTSSGSSTDQGDGGSSSGSAPGDDDSGSGDDDTTGDTQAGSDDGDRAPAGDALSLIDDGFVEPWGEFGWTAEVIDGAVQLNLGDWGGMIVAGGEITETYRQLGVVIDGDVPVDGNDFLRVQLSNEAGSSYPVIVPEFERVDGNLQAIIPTVELLGGIGEFDSVILSAAELFPEPSSITITELYLVPGDPRDDLDITAAGHDASVDCMAAGTPISEHIYGFSRTLVEDPSSFDMNPGSRRWGGNSTTRYNPEIGAWNLAADYYWQNIDISGDEPAHETFIRLNGENDVQSAITVPILGWVAKDTSSYAFPVSNYGEQTDVDPDNPDIGNGIDLEGNEIPPPGPAITGTQWTPADAGAWVREMREYAEARGEDDPFMYFLDNEPMLWPYTHRDVYDGLLGYDELLERSLSYGSAIRAADPDALIAGPAVWGWPAYFFSSIDFDDDNFNDTPDRAAHGGVPLLEWYLQQMAAHEAETGVRLLDVLDIHFYPQDGSYPDGVDQQIRDRRLRSTRSLWDPNYTEESWINEPVRLIPRVQGWIDDNYPGTKISIGEYSFGAYRDISGGIAQAEALGRFGQFGVFSAYFWWEQSLFESPLETPVYWAFRAFRNYDGEGSTFGDISLASNSNRPISVFASKHSDRDENVLVLVNISPDEQRETEIELIGCDRTAATALQYLGNPDGFDPVSSSLDDDVLSITLPPYSITVVELT